MVGVSKYREDEIRFILSQWRNGVNKSDIATKCNKNFKRMSWGENAIKYIIMAFKNEDQ